MFTEQMPLDTSPLSERVLLRLKPTMQYWLFCLLAE